MSDHASNSSTESSPNDFQTEAAESNGSKADSPPKDKAKESWTRRDVIVAGSTIAGIGAAGFAINRFSTASPVSPVFIAKADDYDVDLRRILEAGLAELGVDRNAVKGKFVVLKPNLVEPSSTSPHVNTHPQLIRATVEAFRAMDVARIVVAEGQGHVRDSLWVLEQSKLGAVLEQERIEFVDLNHDAIVTVPNRLKRSKLKELHLPKTIVSADLVVSMPKLKTHHWAGATISMKNLFGVMPGVAYGWPKNVLHHAGIENSIMDIYAAVRPRLAIVDGVIGMEGDGPIMGTPKKAGLIIMGSNLPAVDATGVRLMGLNVGGIDYLTRLPRTFGPMAEGGIPQRGETIASLRQKFNLVDHPSMKRFGG